MEPWRVYRPVVVDSYYFDKQKDDHGWGENVLTFKRKFLLEYTYFIVRDLYELTIFITSNSNRRDHFI